MSYMTINNRRVEFTDEKNVLSVIRKSGIDLPTFCYHSELSTYGACRMCVVEDDRGRIFASCSETPRDKMVIYTNTPRLKHHRKMIIELLLASHCRDCTTCTKNGVCVLQKLSRQLGIKEVRFEKNKKQLPKDLSSECIIRDPNKCILCGDCVRTCDEIQGMGILDFAFRGSKMQVTTAFNKDLAQTDCVGCGQCRAVCPTGAITIKQDIERVWEALSDPEKRVVVQIAPAVRVAVGDKFGIPKGENVLGRLVAALRRIGFDEVYDTNFGADLTVMEESKELVERLESSDNLPLFTSCCPAWVKFCENRYPQFRKNISTCRSPQEMFGALIKEEARMGEADDSRKTVVVSIMPCTAKKAEITRPEHFNEGEQNVDYVLTTTEASRMIQESGIDLTQVEPEALDMPFGISSGAGAIFGVTGGVTEAVLRRLMNSDRAEDLEAISFTGVRGVDGIKEASVKLGDRDVKIAVVNGLKCASEVLDKLDAGEIYYDFVEVMACKRGCITGGGQPVPIGPRTKKARVEGLYKIDKMAQIKLSSQNPIVATVYDGILKGKEHKLLHNEK
ncbi:[FeFe] hydrogenase, group A [Anaerostipes caccae]|jgi:NADH-quinone oxidoreductase subunit G|uniref:[FeFe] hydrogenase, group A n=1 Tax=Anaerostipes caccae TaxID=105841 RepID=UPI001D096C52|nr:[FeFe] hydrogenase, group A [Anaerostipes caccae]MCB6294127.1 [FeFe] hydrogenase, group A [Anaerostipes caccae]MCB6336122.1 [FeFe] hydrogenase, group A [Anaerostipes caccae]MCB6339226.1 [FeFe] hydrogenase, group A [Anaerostipes caccae]MCB6351849.1 [FeFe] hydrogenase, group A [Anaerostipes caccae]MCB6359526.1 [FeFe] hydrogenase, group A [Anaerostipes caccae]